MRHPIEHAEHQVKYGCMQVWLLTLGGLLFFFWPLAIGATIGASGTRHVQWWAWLVEVPWLIIAITIAGLVARRGRP